MKKKLNILLPLVMAPPFTTLTLILSSCDNKAFLKQISTNEALELINKNKDNEQFVLLDVRTKGEINESYIDGMTNIDFNNINLFDSELAKLDKTKTYLVYCRTQNRSAEAAKLMHKKGFKYVYWINCWCLSFNQ